MNPFAVVIPARFASTRLPGKPLRDIAGQSMIRRVHAVAMASNASEVWIATDDERVEREAKSFGANVLMTRSDHGSGTERLAEVCDTLAWPDDLVVVNLQGDEPLMPAELINECADLLHSGEAEMATLASPLFRPDDYSDPNVVKVVTDAHFNALYFSRAGLPFNRDSNTAEQAQQSALRHHGIYAYRRHVIRRLVEASPCTLEQCEKLEQLRALWLGIRIRIGLASVQPGPGVDTQADLDAVETLLKNR